VPVVHACNPSYSGGRNQEDCSRSQPQQIVCETLSQKQLSQKGTGGGAQNEGPEFKLYCCKKKVNNSNNKTIAKETKMLALVPLEAIWVHVIFKTFRI
jgi:hypothetical protein